MNERGVAKAYVGTFHVDVRCESSVQCAVRLPSARKLQHGACCVATGAPGHRIRCTERADALLQMPRHESKKLVPSLSSLGSRTARHVHHANCRILRQSSHGVVHLASWRIREAMKRMLGSSGASRSEIPDRESYNLLLSCTHASIEDSALRAENAASICAGASALGASRNAFLTRAASGRGACCLMHASRCGRLTAALHFCTHSPTSTTCVGRMAVRTRRQDRRSSLYIVSLTADVEVAIRLSHDVQQDADRCDPKLAGCRSSAEGGD